jgi:hypothetical protein
VKKKRVVEPEPMDFQEDHELESVSLDELERERLLDIEEEEDMEDFYLPPERPLKFE